MRFVPDAEQLEFARALREMLASADVPSTARGWANGDAAPARKLWARLTELGLAELAADPVGLVLAFEEVGRAAVPGADAVYLVEGGTISTARVAAVRESVDRARLLAEVEAVEPLGEVDPGPAFERGVLATAAQVLGAGAALLDRATAYAKQRSQFGKPVGSFQAVKHQLADAAVGLDLARPLLFGAALALDSDTASRDVSAAKVACTDAAYRSARVALQVHGAIGYTFEYDLALWLTKVRALTFAWGTQRAHRDRVLAALR
jgi:alkylation response protein AidB-like acyl-CoA dehydrogenase